jgi:hypothetical protein
VHTHAWSLSSGNAAEIQKKNTHTQLIYILFVFFPDTTLVMNTKKCQEEEIFISKSSIKLLTLVFSADEQILDSFF